MLVSVTVFAPEAVQPVAVLHRLEPLFRTTESDPPTFTLMQPFSGTPLFSTNVGASGMYVPLVGRIAAGISVSETNVVVSLVQVNP